ncbi:MAG: hypothetical protein IPG17_01660 [Sandaracinaceae bacterium]|nr:hypothetical protein [Sandaracinaceae bacterium]
MLECVEKSLLGTVTLGVFSGMCEEIGTRDCFNYEFARFRQMNRRAIFDGRVSTLRDGVCTLG